MVRVLAALSLLLFACSDRTNGANASSGAGTSTEVAGRRGSADIPRATALDCRDPIGALEAPGEGYEVIAGAVAIVTSDSSPVALQTSASGSLDPARRLFAKTGLLVRTGVEFELLVPPEWVDRLSFGWGNTGRRRPSPHLVVGPCDGDTDWIAFPGGYSVSGPACVDLIVRAAGEEHRRSVGVGAPCVGQHEPPEPTDD